MTDFELFRKYNLFAVNPGQEKNQDLIDKIYYRSNLNADTQHLQSPKVLVLMHGNYTCNLNCIYCEHHLLREDYQKAVMPLDIAEQVVRKLGPMIRELTWHGGEPTLLPMSLIEGVEEYKKKYNCDFATSLQTNATLLTPEKIADFERLNIRWGTSFDGLANNHNRGQLSTEKILSLYKNHKKGHIPGFITVYTKETAHTMIENYEYYKTIEGIPAFQSCIVRENIIENTNPYLLDGESSAKYFLEYLDYWIHDTNNPLRDHFLERQIRRVLGKTSICEDGDCIRGWIIIDPFGNIGQCGQPQYSNGFVNIKDIEDYNDLFYHPKFLEQIGKQKALMNSCYEKKCPWASVCNGGCMGNNYEFDPTYSQVNPRGCEFNIQLLNGIYELIKDIDLENDADKYNPYFVQLLKNHCYFSLSEIKKIEQQKKEENVLCQTQP